MQGKGNPCIIDAHALSRFKRVDEKEGDGQQNLCFIKGEGQEKLINLPP